MAAFDSLWRDLQRSLRRNQQISGWSREKSDTGLRFKIRELDATSVTILPGRGLPRRIGKGDFDRVFAYWKPYCRGEISRHEMAQLSQNTSYIFAILKWWEAAGVQ